MGGAVSSGASNDELVDNLVDGSCIRSRDVERAFRMVDRADYFLPRSRGNAYKDVAWKSGHYHLSAPCVYSEVMEGLCLQPGNSFLNIGSGTGYLSTMAGLLLGTTGVNHGIEIHEDLVQYARHKVDMFKKYSGAIDEFEFCEPHFAVGNGLCLSHGKLGDFREYDRVYCGAACPEAFETQVWRLVAVGGILVMPCNDQLLQLRRKAGDTWDACPLLGVTFATLLPPPSNVDHTEQERKDHRTIAMTLFSAAPPTLQHLCRSLIRTTLRAVVLESKPDLYKAARKPVPNPKCISRRVHRPTGDDDQQRPPSTGTQRVTLSLGSNGRLNIDRSGAETEAARRARARLLGQRLVSARNGGAERNDDAPSPPAPPTNRCADVGAGGRRALAQAVGNYRVERLLEHLCQEMILEPIADEAEQESANGANGANGAPNIDDEMGILLNIRTALQMDIEQLVQDVARPNATDAAVATDDNQRETERQEATSSLGNSTAAEAVQNATKKSKSLIITRPDGSTTARDEQPGALPDGVYIIASNDEADMETDSEHEHENLTETEHVTVTVNNQTTPAAAAATSSSNSDLGSSPDNKSDSAPSPSNDNNADKMDIDDQQPRQQSCSTNTEISVESGQLDAPSDNLRANESNPNHRFAGFRFHNNKQASKRSSSNSSLKKSSKRRNHLKSDNSASSGDDDNHRTSTSSSSTSSSSSSDDTSSDDSSSDNGASRAQIVHLYDITSRLEANNNLADISSDEDSDEYNTSSGRLSGQEDAAAALLESSVPLVVRSDYTQHIVNRIRLLPLPKRLQMYVNYDRELEEQEEELEDNRHDADDDGVEEILVQVDRN